MYRWACHLFIYLFITPHVSDVMGVIVLSTFDIVCLSVTTLAGEQTNRQS